jgi:ABC-type hemin transport system substrate-binding protein
MRAMALPDPVHPEPGPDAGVDDIQADIERTRKELGETVEALSDKLDVKQRAKDKAEETKQRVANTTHSVGRVATQPRVAGPVIVVLVVGAVAAGVVIWRRRR